MTAAASPARLLAPTLPAAVVLGHATGFSWDEALMVLAPIAVIAGVLLYVNQKLRRGLDAAEAPPAADADHPGAPEAEPVEPGDA